MSKAGGTGTHRLSSAGPRRGEEPIPHRLDQNPKRLLGAEGSEVVPGSRQGLPVPVATRKPLHHSGTGLDLGSRGSKLTHGLGGVRMQAPSTAVPALRDQPCGCCPDAGTHTDFRTGCAGHRRPTAQNALALSLQGSGVGILQLSLLA